MLAMCFCGFFAIVFCFLFFFFCFFDESYDITR